MMYVCRSVDFITCVDSYTHHRHQDTECHAQELPHARQEATHPLTPALSFSVLCQPLLICFPSL